MGRTRPSACRCKPPDPQPAPVVKADEALDAAHILRGTKFSRVFRSAPPEIRQAYNTLLDWLLDSLKRGDVSPPADAVTKRAQELHPNLPEHEAVVRFLDTPEGERLYAEMIY